MNSLVLIGAGQLGSRYLQGLAALKFPLKIYVIDPSENSLQIAKDRYQAVSDSAPGHTIEYQKDLLNIPTEVDIAIITTRADIRREITESLLKKAAVKKLVLEKILFPKEADYLAIQSLIQEKNIDAYVNCPMRMVPYYRKLKEYCSNSPIAFNIVGHFGVASNMIHFIDLLSFLANDESYTLELEGLDKKLHASKRNGYFEYHGSAFAKFSHGSCAHICSLPEAVPMVIQATSNHMRAQIHEDETYLRISLKANEWKWEEEKISYPYQSQLTAILVTDLIEKGSCELNSFQGSMNLHLPYLRAMLAHVNKYESQKFDALPFT